MLLQRKFSYYKYSLSYALFYSSTNQYFSFPKFYKCFDIYQDEGQRLVDILLDLMSNENDELRASSAALLFDIYYVCVHTTIDYNYNF